MNISQNDIVTTGYLFLVVAGIISLIGAIVVYYNNPPKKRRGKYEYK